MKLNLCVFTSTRADFGLLKPLLKKIAVSNTFNLQLFVTGSHLDQKYGYTIDEVSADFSSFIKYKVPIELGVIDAKSSLVTMANCLKSYAEEISNSKPDIVLVLGDRFETFMFSIVCAQFRIPIVHIHGGEVSLGALDDKFRNAITKLSELHLTSCDVHAGRVMQMGEESERVKNVGALGVENALTVKKLSKPDLLQQLSIVNFENYFIITFHPETSVGDFGLSILKAFLLKLDLFLKSRADFYILFTGVNHDLGSDKIEFEIKKFISDHNSRSSYILSLGSERYLSAVQNATAVIGNSSSGLFEAHSLRTPAVILGRRQLGRESERSVIHLTDDEDIRNFDFSTLIQTKNEMTLIKNLNSRFGGVDVSNNIMIELENFIKSNIYKRPKTFTDFRFSGDL